MLNSIKTRVQPNNLQCLHLSHDESILHSICLSVKQHSSSNQNQCHARTHACTHVRTCMHTRTTILRLSGFCPGQGGWAGNSRNIHPHTYHGHQSSLICFLHLLRSMASSQFKLRTWQSFSTTSLQVFFGLPLGLAPSTSYSIHFFNQSLSSFQSQHMPIPSQPVLLWYRDCHLILVSLSTL